MKKRYVALAFAAILCGIIGIKALKKSEGEIFESITPGESEASIYERLGQPSDINETSEFKDLRYWITYKDKDGYSLLGTSMGFPRIIRIQNGIVVSKGRNEDYNDPHKPGWILIKNEG